MSIQDDIIISKIERVRAENNKHWMKILKLALRGEDRILAKNLIRKISECDKEINQLTIELGEEE